MSFERGNLDELDANIVQLELLVNAVQESLNENMEKIAKDHIIPEIVGISLAMNMPRQFGEGVRIVKFLKDMIKIINVWGTPEKPLAKWFNYGTRDHGPKTANVMHWKSKDGKDIYAKFVHGVPKTNAMELGISLGKKRFIDSLLVQARYDASKELHLSA